MWRANKNKIDRACTESFSPQVEKNYEFQNNTFFREK